MAKKAMTMQGIVIVSVIFGVLMTFVSYGIPGSGIQTSPPISLLSDIGGYPFVIAMSPCPIPVSGTINLGACGSAHYDLLGMAIDVSFWSAIAFPIIYFFGMRKSRHKKKKTEKIAWLPRT